MTRLMLAVAGLLAAAAIPALPAPAETPVAAPADGDWSSVVRLQPDGVYVVGNPAAPVKLAEHLSYTCPHCAAFSIDSSSALIDEMVKSGSVMIEYHPVARDDADVAATMLLQCAGPTHFVAMNELIFIAQPRWIDRAIAFQSSAEAANAAMPSLQKLRILAERTGLADLARVEGLTTEQIDACLADKPLMDRVVALGAKSRQSIRGTPSFFLNGTAVPAADWATLEPVLRARGAK